MIERDRDQAPRRVLYVHEAATYLGIKEPTLHRYRKTDPLFPKPFRYDDGGDPKFDVRDLDLYIERVKQLDAERRCELESAPEGIVEAVRRARAS